MTKGRIFKATTEVCEAHLHQAYKSCAIGAIPSQTYWYILKWSPEVGIIIHVHRFVMELLQ